MTNELHKAGSKHKTWFKNDLLSKVYKQPGGTEGKYLL